MYHVAGSQLYTSKRIVAAEQRIIELAGRSDGRRVDEIHVSLALLASAANGVDLNEGQTDLVRQMATSGARVQLALAAAGSGKTTALKVLADAWREGGGEVLGLAPSAVAAGILRDQVGNATTLAKLVWDLHHGHAGEASGIGPGTLVIVDEAGMADTISLAHVLDHVVGCGGSVRLIGDDQQLASVSAGGVLRDISRLHGAVELTELMRFADRAEGAASLALREGRPEALGYYLDEDRIHAGTRESSVEAAFQGWATDLAEGRDSLMLASTKECVAELNRRAREHRLALSDQQPGPEVLLGDGNRAGVGDVIVTRLNARQLRVSATDWVKNGDRWTVEQVSMAGIKARHRDSGLRVMLPAAYVTDHVQLGYAVTVHTAQGLTLDTAHGVLTGSESRQQLYVMMTRGRLANHVYVPVVGDGDEHAVLHPSSLRPETAVDVLEGILSRDGAARSATTEHREATAPAVRLADAAAQYLDGLHVAAESMLQRDVIQALDHGANEVVEGLTDCSAWPTLRSTLLLNALDGRHPLDELRTAALTWELDSARDPAAVLTWRIQSPTGNAPLPWLPPIPDALRDEPNWSRYLSICAGAVRRSTRELQQESQNPGRPVWALPGQQLAPALIGEVEVWRAAVGVDPSDRRATGRVQLGAAARAWQRHLDNQLQPGVTPWADALAHLHPEIRYDPYTATLAHRVADFHTDGVDITKMLVSAAAERPLPAEHAAAALWWRLARRLSHNDHIGTVEPSHTPSILEHPRALETHAFEADARKWWPIPEEAHRQPLAVDGPPRDGVPSTDERSELHHHNQTANSDESQGRAEPAGALTTRPQLGAASQWVRQEHLRGEDLRRPRPSGPTR